MFSRVYYNVSISDSQLKTEKRFPPAQFEKIIELIDSVDHIHRFTVVGQIG